MNGEDDLELEGLSFAETTVSETPSIGDEVEIAVPDLSGIEGMDQESPTMEEVVRLLDQIGDHLGKLDLDEYVKSDLEKELAGARQLIEDEGAPRQLLGIALETVTKKLEAAYDTGENVHQLLPWAQMAQEIVKSIYGD